MHAEHSNPPHSVQLTGQHTPATSGHPVAATHTASDFVVTPEGLAALRAYDEPIPYACVERGAAPEDLDAIGWVS